MTPGHQITIEPTDEHVTVVVEGETVAASTRTLRLDETGMPPRFYFPRDDVRIEVLRPTAFETTCPFKGQASYWTLQLGDAVHDGLVWSYEEPIPAAEAIAGRMSFFNERVEIRVNGEPIPAA
jgi:uncharacterized protein (DUF427 family)